jgi:hypothetical protein
VVKWQVFCLANQVITQASFLVRGLVISIAKIFLMQQRETVQFRLKQVAPARQGFTRGGFSLKLETGGRLIAIITGTGRMAMVPGLTNQVLGCQKTWGQICRIPILDIQLHAEIYVYQTKSSSTPTLLICYFDFYLYGG